MVPDQLSILTDHEIEPPQTNDVTNFLWLGDMPLSLGVNINRRKAPEGDFWVEYGLGVIETGIDDLELRSVLCLVLSLESFGTVDDYCEEISLVPCQGVVCDFDLVMLTSVLSCDIYVYISAARFERTNWNPIYEIKLAGFWLFDCEVSKEAAHSDSMTRFKLDSAILVLGVWPWAYFMDRTSGL